PDAGDGLQQGGEGGGRVVGGGTGTADAAGHEDGAGQDRGRLGQQLVGVEAGHWLRDLVLPDAGQQGVERDLPGDVATVPALVVEVVRVPLTEDVVRPAVDRVAVVVGAHVQG